MLPEMNGRLFIAADVMENDSFITSAVLEVAGGHEVLRIWIRGKSVGELTFGTGDAEVFAKRFLELEEVKREDGTHILYNKNSKCPGCQTEGGVTLVPADYPMPTPGDVQVCMGCGEVLILNEDFSLRFVRDDEYEVVPPDAWETAAAVRTKNLKREFDDE